MGGAKETRGEVLCPSKKPLLPFTRRGENQVSENLFATAELKLSFPACAKSIEIYIKLFMFDESSILIFFKGDSQLLLGIHNNGAIPGDRLFDGPPRY